VSRRQRRQQRRRRQSARALAAVAVVAVVGTIGALAGIATAADEPKQAHTQAPTLRRAPVVTEPSLVTASAVVQARTEERFKVAVLEHTAAEQAAVKAARDSIWDRIAACETQGNWSMRGSSFSGGVGFANAAWSQWGGREFAPNAGQATRDQQIVVAERIRAAVGLGAWGCAKTLGLTGR
jgi:Transglycosylase-like domain